MPGSPGFGPTVPLDKRSRGQLIGWIIVGPVVGAACLLMSIFDTLTHSAEWGFKEWFFRLGWMSILGLGLAIGLPGTALRELRRRNQADQPKQQPTHDGVRNAR